MSNDENDLLKYSSQGICTYACYGRACTDKDLLAKPQKPKKQQCSKEAGSGAKNQEQEQAGSGAEAATEFRSS